MNLQVKLAGMSAVNSQVAVAVRPPRTTISAGGALVIVVCGAIRATFASATAAIAQGRARRPAQLQIQAGWIPCGEPRRSTAGGLRSAAGDLADDRAADRHRVVEHGRDAAAQLQRVVGDAELAEDRRGVEVDALADDPVGLRLEDEDRRASGT